MTTSNFMGTDGSTFYMHNIHGRPILIPFHVCDVQQTILSVTRLAEQGLRINFHDNPTITHSKGFTSSLRQKDGLYFLPIPVVPLLDNMVLNIKQTSNGAKATISPIGAETMRGGSADLWTYNNDRYLVKRAKHFSHQMPPPVRYVLRRQRR